MDTFTVIITETEESIEFANPNISGFSEEVFAAELGGVLQDPNG